MNIKFLEKPEVFIFYRVGEGAALRLPQRERTKRDVSYPQNQRTGAAPRVRVRSLVYGAACGDRFSPSRAPREMGRFASSLTAHTRRSVLAGPSVVAFGLAFALLKLVLVLVAAQLA